MTRDQIIAKWNALTPRERDAWVADVVFDTTVYPMHGLESFTGEVYDNHTGEPLPSYTEDIAAAWTVFEYIASLGAWTEVAFIPRKLKYRGFIGAASVPKLSGVDIKADTAPEAISLAAIIAKLAPEK